MAGSCFKLLLVGAVGIGLWIAPITGVLCADVPSPAGKAEAKFAYHPSFHAVSVSVDVNKLATEERAKVRGVTLRIRGEKGGRVFASTSMPPLKNFASRMVWKIPKLEEGRYELVAEIEPLKAEPIILPFVRRVFPWEGNRLGKSEAVVPPFTPIAVNGRKVGTVLRDHAMSDLGLWDQVHSKGVPLLKQPMRLEVRSGGRLRRVKADRLVFQKKQKARVVTRSRWSSGSLAGTATSEWDYDGMMKWTLEMKSSAREAQSVALVIPLDTRLAPLMHACVDNIRFNYAGGTPQGQGRVWDGSKANRTGGSIIGSYVPYIWLGAEERGVCVFGENDRGWVTDPGVPCQELVRRGDRLELRLNLIARPTTLARARKIVIGFQATPTKPMPQNWRAWTMGGRGMRKPVTDARNLSFLGVGWAWGALTAAHDYYPREGDFSLFREFARARRTGVADQAFLQRWLSRHKVEAKLEKDSLLGGYLEMALRPRDVLPYTNPRGVRFDTPEGETFQNEWHGRVFPREFMYQDRVSNNLAPGGDAGRTWARGEGVDYDANLVESFRDYTAWHYKKMLDTFADHIYFDCVYLKPSFDTIGAGAYELPDGRVQPSSGLFEMRALIRRTAVLCRESGKGGANMAHMTNAAVAPLLSFAHTSLTWEDKAGGLDFQDRFSRDYIRAESIGLQHGLVPYVLVAIDGLADAQKKDWAARTAAGVMLVHELRGPGWNQDHWKPNIESLFKFGYGRPDVKVSQYWNTGHPAAVHGSDAATLVVHKPGSALVVVCDYGSGGNLTLDVDTRALGLAGKLKATDVEGGQPLAATADGKVRFPLRKHDFKLILIEGDSP